MDSTRKVQLTIGRRKMCIPSKRLLRLPVIIVCFKLKTNLLIPPRLSCKFVVTIKPNVRANGDEKITIIFFRCASTRLSFQCELYA